MKMRGMNVAVIATLVLTGASVSACRDGRPGYNSDRHHGHDRDHRHDRHDRHGRHDRNDRSWSR
ncbi:hypothetical protein [Sphingobium baderi]|uniref:hypothetical protein n=1 Tax=Sphingobium baderi TaxID=1332080 RepID=UPI000784212F|nr:hypothetical protein [Sphingobium baderi]